MGTAPALRSHAPGRGGSALACDRMIAFLVRRFIQAVIVVLLVLLGVFLLAHVIPGGRPGLPSGLGPRKQQIRQFNVTNNYYKGIFVQFYLYLKGLIWHHNLGTPTR